MFPPELIVPPLASPLRLDKFLVEHFPHTTRAFWRDNLEKLITVEGHPLKKGMLLHGGERIRFSSPENPEESYSPDETVESPVVMKDPSFLVALKPAGLPVHPLKPGERGTLIQGILARFPEIASVGESPREMGLVHRLDNETSGLVLIARNAEAYRFFREEFQKRRVEKEYVALVVGQVAKTGKEKWGKIDLPIAHHPKNKRKMVVSVGAGLKLAREGRQAVTFYQVETNYPGFTLIRVRIPTGVRHQIRVHLAHLGHPIVGDVLYGGVGAGGHLPLQGRFFLHASRLAFRHPITLEKVECESELPTELKEFLKRL